MNIDRNKATELMINANKYIPKFIIFMIICWFATPILMGISSVTKLAFFSVLGVIISFISSILFYGLIICLILRFAKVNVRTTQQNTTSNDPLSPIEKTLPQQEEYSPQREEYLPQEQEYISQVQEYNYNNASYNTSEINYAMSDEQAQKQFEREMFAMQHPVLSFLQEKIIPFIYILAVLFIIMNILVRNGIIELSF